MQNMSFDVVSWWQSKPFPNRRETITGDINDRQSKTRRRGIIEAKFEISH